MTSQLLRMADESVPSSLPEGYSAIAGYIGGATPHVWTAQEWDRFSCRKLPVFVCTGEGGGSSDGWDALRRLYQLDVPKGSPVAYDVETSVFPAAVTTFNAIMRWAGYFTYVYGSISTVFALPSCSGYWVADWTGRPRFTSMHPRIAALQYESGPEFDSSVIRFFQYRRLKVW
jgi:hypothetical protein